MLESDLHPDVDQREVVVEDVRAEGLDDHKPGREGGGDDKEPRKPGEAEVLHRVGVQPAEEQSRPRSLSGAAASMRPVCVVADCAPHCAYVQYAAFRCSSAPGIRGTWTAGSLAEIRGRDSSLSRRDELASAAPVLCIPIAAGLCGCWPPARARERSIPPPERPRRWARRTPWA